MWLKMLQIHARRRAEALSCRCLEGASLAGGCAGKLRFGCALLGALPFAHRSFLFGKACRVTRSPQLAKRQCSTATRPVFCGGSLYQDHGGHRLRNSFRMGEHSHTGARPQRHCSRQVSQSTQNVFNMLRQCYSTDNRAGALLHHLNNLPSAAARCSTLPVLKVLKNSLDLRALHHSSAVVSTQCLQPCCQLQSSPMPLLRAESRAASQLAGAPPAVFYANAAEIRFQRFSNPTPIPSMKVKEIGKGTYGVAELMRDTATGELVAVKFIERGEKVRRRVCAAGWLGLQMWRGFSLTVVVWSCSAR